jgi:putative protease
MPEKTNQNFRDKAEINAKPNNPCGMYRIEQRNKFSVGETIEVMKPNGENIPATVRRMVDAEGNEMDSCPHPKQVFYVDLGMELEEYDILRRAEDEVEQM